MRKVLVVVVLLAAATPLFGASTYAAFNSTTSSSGNSFSTTSAAISITSPGPAQGPTGTTVTVSGSGFPGSRTLSATFGGSSVTLSGTTSTASNGTFSGATFSVPSGVAASTAGAHNVVFTAGTWLSAAVTFTITPAITLIPTSGLPKMSDTISGTGFAANSTITATFSGSGSVTLSGTTTTDANGSFTGTTYTVPAASTVGGHTVTVTDQSTNGGAATYTVIAGLIYSATGPAQTWTSNTTKSVFYPSGTNTNDLLFIVVANTANQAITTPSGWTVLATQITTANLKFELMWKLAAAGDVASSTIASGSNGQSLPLSTISVASTTSFVAGSFEITSSAGVQSVTCTGKSPTTLTGCSGGTGTLSTGNAVTQSDVAMQVASNGGGASAWVVRYVRVGGGYPPNPASATATVQQGTASAAATLTPSTDVTTNASNATVISFVAIRAANTLSLGTARGFSLESNPTSTPGTASDAFGVADIFQPSAGTPASPTWSQSGTASTWAWATVAFN